MNSIVCWCEGRCVLTRPATGCGTVHTMLLLLMPNMVWWELSRDDRPSPALPVPLRCGLSRSHGDQGSWLPGQPPGKGASRKETHPQMITQGQ